MKPKVLIVLPTDKFLHRQILDGILSYGRVHGPWQFHFETGDRYEQRLQNGNRWGCTGVIAMVRERRQLDTILGTKFPSVILNPPEADGDMEARPPAWATFVRRNQENVGRTAADYFIDRGYRHFAFVGVHGQAHWCDRRRNGFVGRLAQDGFPCNIFKGAPKRLRENFDLEAKYLSAWLKTLVPGTALYAVRDRRALQVLGLCMDEGITVPDTVAVLGTDNDELLCETSAPSLSSIALDGNNAGNLCAQLLDMRMRGREVEPLLDLSFPRVVTRMSTDMNLVTDPFVAKALSLVRNDLAANRPIKAIAAELGISERSLEIKAKRVLGTTFKSEVNRIRLNEAVRLVSNTTLSLQDVAEKCGYCCTSHMGTAFRTVFGHPPSVFRYQAPRR